MTSDNTTNAPEMVTQADLQFASRWAATDSDVARLAEAAARHRHQSASPSGLVEAATKARDKFLHYEDLHRLKCTAEGDEKADRNREMADMLTAAITAAPATAGEGDNCQLCYGANGGVRGNENRIGGLVVCDYCTVKLSDHGLAPIPSASGEAIEALIGRLMRREKKRVRYGGPAQDSDYHSVLVNPDGLEAVIEIERLRALTQSPPPNDAVRELLREARSLMSEMIRSGHAHTSDVKYEPNMYSYLVGDLPYRIDAALSAQPAPVEGVEADLAACERAIDRMGWAEIQAFMAEPGQSPSEDGGGYLLRKIKALFGIRPDRLETYREAANRLVAEARANDGGSLHQDRVRAALHPSTESGRTPVAGEGENNAWKRYATDFNGMTDAEVERERESAQNLVDENEEWLEAVASWEAAGKPRPPVAPDKERGT